MQSLAGNNPVVVVFLHFEKLTWSCNLQNFFFVVKMKIFTGKILIFFLIFAQLEPPHQGGSN